MRINKKNSLILFCAIGFVLVLSQAYAQASDFGGYRPHYQGFGTETPGGRGGQIIKVTHLKDTTDIHSADWQGSFRKAITTAGPRIIVFDVCGVINLVYPIQIT